MKLKNIFVSLVAAAATLTGCVEQELIPSLEGLDVSNSYLTLAAEEGSTQTITVKGESDWTVAIDEKVDWLSATPASGSANELVTVTLKALKASAAARKTEVSIVMGEKTKIVVVNQAAPQGVEVKPSTCQEVIDGPDATYKVTGTCTRIANTSYGNWYLADETGEIYIYGTVNSKGQYPKDADGGWAGFGIEVGDKVTVEGPKTVYNGTTELVDVTIVKIEKSLIGVKEFDFDMLPPTDTTFLLSIEAKVSPLLVTSDAEWLQVADVQEGDVYVLHADANDYTAVRTATVTIKAPGAIKTVEIKQKGIPATGATVTDIIAMADASEVETLESTTIAKTTRGVVVWDGTNAVYVYGDKAADVKVGDNVKVFGTKKTYNGVPEIELGKDNDAHKVIIYSSGNTFENPTATDVTANAGTYTAAKAEYIKLTGTLKVSGNYLNLLLDEFPEGEHQGSIVNPVDDLNAKSYDGKKITITGWFNGLSGSGKYINIITNKIVEFVDNPKGTATNPYTIADITALILGGDIPEEDVYIKGIVSSVLYTASASYPTTSFWLSDDGVAYGVTEDKKKTTEPTKDFECYSVKWFDNADWAEGNGQVTVGDEVIVCGKTTVYGGVAETSSKKAWLYSVNYVKIAGVGLGSTEFPFNVAGAEAVIDYQKEEIAAATAAEAAAPVFKDVCVKGKVSAVLYTFSASYGTGTFWISDDGTAYGVSDDKKKTSEPTKDFECYSVYWFNNTPWTESNSQIAVGDDVIVKGQLTIYNGTYETASKKAWVYSHNGATE